MTPAHASALESLPPRERQVVDALYRNGPSTAEAIRRTLPSALHNSTIRTILRSLEVKGVVVRQRDGRRFVYAPAVRRQAVQRRTLRRVVETLFAGSAARAMSALIDLGDDMTPDELAAIEARMRQLRKQRS